MSQEKVDYNKEAKRNRKKTLKKQKVARVAATVVSLAVVVAIGGWIVFSAYTRSQEQAAENVETYAVDASALTEYMSSLSE